MDIAREDGTLVTIDLPLFWYDPPWCDVTADTADILATAVAQTGVLVSALRNDLAGADGQSHFHRADPDGDPKSAEHPAQGAAARIVPYRPERYGLNLTDFDGATIIDVRLTVSRDRSGRFAFSPSQIERWEKTPTSEPLAGGGWVAAATFPPDVVSMEHLSSKLSQLRVLSPTAAVLVSINPYRMKLELPSVLDARPDGLILRLDQEHLEGLQLAALTRRARKMMDGAGATSVPLWVVPGDITADDAVKLIALGASAVAVDGWCNPLISEAAERQRATAAQLGYLPANPGDETYLRQLAHYQLAGRIDRFRGLGQSLLQAPPDEQLGSFSAIWAEPLRVKALR